MKITVNKHEKTFFLKSEDIYLIKTKDRGLALFTENEIFETTKKLYEFKEILGYKFLQISKSSIVNMDYVLSVEVSYSCSLKVFLKNEQTDYISRFFVKSFKRYLGL